MQKISFSLNFFDSLKLTFYISSTMSAQKTILLLGAIFGAFISVTVLASKSFPEKHPLSCEDPGTPVLGHPDTGEYATGPNISINLQLGGNGCPSLIQV